MIQNIFCKIFLDISLEKISVKKNVLIEVTDNLISKITNDYDIQKKKINNCIILDKHIVCPGLVNTHAHLPMTLLKGLGDDQKLQDWLHNVIFPLEAKLVNPSFCKLGTNLALLEMVRTGTTCVTDMYYYEDTIANAAKNANVRGLFGENILTFPTPDNPKIDNSSYNILNDMIAEFKDSDLITTAIAPHAPYTNSNESLEKAAIFAAENNIPFMIHMCETEHEINESLKEYKVKPFQRLRNIKVLDKVNPICAHCVIIDDKDMAIMKEYDCRAIYNPDSNLKLGSGISPIKKLKELDIKIGIATDGSASNNDLNLVQEMCTGALLQKMACKDTSAITAEDLLIMGTIGGANAIGLQDKIGSIEVGKAADIIAFNFVDNPQLNPMHNPVSQIVYASSGYEIDFVMCNGKILFKDNEYKTLDKDKILYEVNQFQSKNF